MRLAQVLKVIPSMVAGIGLLLGTLWAVSMAQDITFDSQRVALSHYSEE